MLFKVAQRLVEGNKDLLNKHGKNKDWSVCVVEDKTVNAFVLSVSIYSLFKSINFRLPVVHYS